MAFPASEALPTSEARRVAATPTSAEATSGAPTAAAPAIEATAIDKSFGPTLAVDGASLRVGRGQLVAVVGPSGSGKTTLLRIIAGFEAPDAGTIRVGGVLVAGDSTWTEPDRRRIGMVFQDGALFPHLTVEANVAFGRPRAGRVESCLDLVGLGARARAYPHELSGGERQRVALARALAPEPEVVLFDEPFVSLDTGLREALRVEVAAILADAGASALLVTHDQDEALSMADEVAVMCEGRIEQAGRPEELYATPGSSWVATFLGDAEVLAGTASAGVARCELGAVPADPLLEGPVEVVVRPERVRLARTGGDDGDGETGGGSGHDDPTNGEGAVIARVTSRRFHGHDQVVTVELASGRRLRSRTAGLASWSPGDRVSVRLDGPANVLAVSAG